MGTNKIDISFWEQNKYNSINLHKPFQLQENVEIVKLQSTVFKAPLMLVNLDLK